jgi:AraC-like DNA-binding protein
MYRRPRHFHDEPEVNLVARGSARIGVGDKSWLLHVGDAVVLQPGQDHELLEASPGLELYVFAVRPELAARDAELLKATSGVASFGSAELCDVVQALRELGDVASSEARERGLLGICSSVVSKSRQPNALARRALTALRRERNLPGAALAERLNTTQSALSRTFRDSFGLPLVEYRARLRLLELVRLVDSGQTLSQAALNADFGSYAQCFRVFQRALRCSPTQYFGGHRREIDARLR